MKRETRGERLAIGMFFTALVLIPLALGSRSLTLTIAALTLTVAGGGIGYWILSQRN